MRMPPLPADFIHARACKLKCEKILTRPVLVDPFEFKVVVAPGLGVAPSHRISGFQQAVAVVAVFGFNLFGIFGFKLA